MTRHSGRAAAVLGMALSTLILACAPAGPRPAPPRALTVSDGVRSNAGSDPDLAGIQARLVEISARLDQQSAAIERAVEAIAELSRMRSKGPGERSGFRRDAGAGTVLNAKNVLAVQSLRGWEDDARVRERWLFSSEESIIEAMGTPDEVRSAGEHAEYVEWGYWIPTASGDDERWWELTFLNGRLVYCDEP